MIHSTVSSICHTQHFWNSPKGHTSLGISLQRNGPAFLTQPILCMILLSGLECKVSLSRKLTEEMLQATTLVSPTHPLLLHQWWTLGQVDNQSLPPAAPPCPLPRHAPFWSSFSEGADQTQLMQLASALPPPLAAAWAGEQQKLHCHFDSCDNWTPPPCEVCPCAPLLSSFSNSGVG